MWRLLKRFFCSNERLRYQHNIEIALALNRRGEVRSDGLRLKNTSNRLTIEWSARNIHPWDRDLEPEQRAALFVEQCLDDTEAGLTPINRPRRGQWKVVGQGAAAIGVFDAVKRSGFCVHDARRKVNAAQEADGAAADRRLVV